MGIDITAKNIYYAAMHFHETVAPPPDLLVTGYYKEQYGYGTYRSRGSGNWLITYTVAGSGLYRQPGMEIRTKPGDIVLLGPSALHDYSVPPEGSWEFLWAHFHPRPSWLSWWQLPEAGDGLFLAHLRARYVRERARRAFLTLHVDTRSPGALQAARAMPAPLANAGAPWAACGPDATQRELALNGLEEVLLLAVRETADRGQRPLDSRVQQVLDLISGDLAAPHDLPTLAREAGLSPSRLAHVFKQEVGDSIINTVLSLRLRQAARLLEFTGRGVGAIAEEVGFTSAFYFSRQFRRHFGISPRHYRAALSQERAAPKR